MVACPELQISQVVKMVINQLVRVAVATLLFYSLCASASTVKVAVIDTGFCFEEKVSPLITIHPEFDASLKAKGYCKFASARRLHGQKVLRELLRGLKNSQDMIELFPIVVFDNDGYASIEAFSRAIERSKTIGVDYLLLSVALALEGNVNPFPPLPVPTFVAAGRAERLIDQRTILWPHHWDDPQMFLVGGLTHGKRDHRALYSQKTDLYFEGSSSLANAHALAKAITSCASVKQNLKKCLGSLSK